MPSRPNLYGWLVNQIASELSQAEAVASHEKTLAWRQTARPKQLPPPGDWFCWMILSGRGFGKSLALDTPIPTIDGWKMMGDIAVGDTLFDEQGQPCRVTYVAPIRYNRDCFEVVFSDGTRIVADGKHEWVTTDRRARKNSRRCKDRTKHQPSTVTTYQIKATLYDAGEVNHAVACTQPLACPERNLPIHPYVLGAWLGDGTTSVNVITCADEDVAIVERIAAVGYAVKRHGEQPPKAPTYTIGLGGISERDHAGRFQSNNSLYTVLRQQNLLSNKHIPAIYQRASIAQRLDLLRGLMDTDGSATPGGNCELTTVDRQLAYDVYELVVGLGIKASIITGRATLDGRDCGEKYRITFTPYIDVFNLPRKAARLHKAGKQAERQRRRYITDVRPMPSVPVRCISVDSPSHLYLASRSMIPTHNTFTGANWTIEQAYTEPGCVIALIGQTKADVRDTMVELGESSILKQSPDWFMPVYEPSKRRVVWPNGSVAIIYSGDEPDQLRGPQHHYAWVDELAKFRFAQETFDMMEFGLRLGTQPRVLVTTTPRPIPIIKRLLKDPQAVIITGSTFENEANLPAHFLTRLKEKYENTRIGQQELYAAILDDVPGALWTRQSLEDTRVVEAPALARIVVAIDPAVTANEDSNETGIVVMGVGVDKQGYVLDDMSLRGSPDQWGKQAVAAYHKYKADRIIAETNNGGDMIEHVIKTVGGNVPFKQVHASRGKQTRAEPVAALYEQRRVHHVGMFAELEDQLCSWLPGDTSPDRLDAMVWAATELMLELGELVVGKLPDKLANWRG